MASKGAISGAGARVEYRSLTGTAHVLMEGRGEQ